LHCIVAPIGRVGAATVRNGCAAAVAEVADAAGGACRGGSATRSPPRAAQSATVLGSFTQVPSLHSAIAESGGTSCDAGVAAIGAGGGVTGSLGYGAPCARADAGALIRPSATIALQKKRVVTDSPSG
jgi:hypothetical protein